MKAVYPRFDENRIRTYRLQLQSLASAPANQGNERWSHALKIRWSRPLKAAILDTHCTGANSATSGAEIMSGFLDNIRSVCGAFDFGDVPTWVGAIATGGALWFAAITYRRAVDNRRKEQAGRVSVIHQRISYQQKSNQQTGQVEESGEALVRVANRNPVSIYDCEVSLLSWDWKGRSSKALSSLWVSNIQPESETTELEFSVAPQPKHLKRDWGLPRPPIRLTFTDNHGSRWRRWPDGKLDQ